MFEECQSALILLLEDFIAEEVDIDSVVDAILFMMGRLGEDVVAHLDPPLGLKTWLDSHGLSLVPTKQPPAPPAWRGDDEEEEPDVPETEYPVLKVGDRVRYQTQAQGPWKQSQLGAGTVVAIRQTGTGLVVTVQTSVTERIHLDLGQGDQVAVIHPT